MCRPRRANSFARMLPGVATPWPAAPPMPTEKSILGMAVRTAVGVEISGPPKEYGPVPSRHRIYPDGSVWSRRAGRLQKANDGESLRRLARPFWQSEEHTSVPQRNQPGGSDG